MNESASRTVDAVSPVAAADNAGLPTARPARLVALGRSLAGRSVARLRSIRLDRMPQVGRTTGIGAVLMVASGVLWLSTIMPMTRNIETLQTEVANLESTARSGATIARSPSAQVDAFMKGLPTRNELPSIMTVIIAQATDAGLALPSGEYQFTPTRSGQIGRYRLTFPVQGTYPQLRKFIDGTLAALPTVALESLRLERETIGETVLDANLQFAVIVRGTT